MTELSHYLKKRREELGLSQKIVAEELGYSCAQFVSNWERGICLPSLGALKHLSIIYEIPKTKIKILLLKEYSKKIDSCLR